MFYFVGFIRKKKIKIFIILIYAIFSFSIAWADSIFSPSPTTTSYRSYKYFSPTATKEIEEYFLDDFQEFALEKGDFHQDHNLSCEAASLAAAFSYLNEKYNLGYQISSTNSLENKILYESNLKFYNKSFQNPNGMALYSNKGFWGNPYQEFVGWIDGVRKLNNLQGYGVYPGPIAESLNQLLGAQFAIPHYNFDYQSVLEELAQGFPVVVWINFKTYPVSSSQWLSWHTPEGLSVQKAALYEHTVILFGKKPGENIFYYWDVWASSYNKTESPGVERVSSNFKENWESLGKMAVTFNPFPKNNDVRDKKVSSSDIFFADGFEAKWVSQSNSKLSLLGHDSLKGYFMVKPGDVLHQKATFINTGRRVWHNKGKDEVSLAIYKVRGVKSAPLWTNYDNPEFPESFGKSFFKAGNWLSNYKVISLEEEEVKRGEVGNFYFVFKIPRDTPSGIYREDLSLAAGNFWIRNRQNGDSLGIAHIWVGLEVAE